MFMYVDIKKICWLFYVIEEEFMSIVNSFHLVGSNLSKKFMY
jgi:hypothetical protein